MRFTLEYAAPEVAAAWQACALSIEAHPALDVWAFGVMAYEVLTGQPAFADDLSENEVRLLQRCDLTWSHRHHESQSNLLI